MLYICTIGVNFVRVITGSARGRVLLTPEGLDTRPTADRIKHSIFNAIQFDVEGRRVLDLFAGSGQLGIEALSRGAKNCCFVDSNKDAQSAISQNIKNCEFASVSKVFGTDFETFLKSIDEVFDLVFLDPPYKEGLLEKALELVVKKTSSYGIIICEHLKDYFPPETVENFSVYKRYNFGRTTSVTLYRASNGEEC